MNIIGGVFMIFTFGDTFNPSSSGAEPELLWTYAYPNANYEFGATTVALDLSKYEAVMITAKLHYEETKPTSYGYFRKDSQRYNLITVEGGTNPYWRAINVTDTGVIIGSCRIGNTNYTNDTYCKPLKIYGIAKDISKSMT